MQNQVESSWNKLLNKLSGWIDTVILNLPNLIIALITFTVFLWLSRHLNNFLNRSLKKVIRKVSIRELTSNIASICIILLGLVLSLSVLNLDGILKSILAGAGITGLAVGLALQGTLSNTFSGIFLALKDEVRIGDWVETNGFGGEIVDIDLRNTKLKEADNNIVIIPNKMILDNPIKNYGLTKKIRATIHCGVGYESSLEAVERMCKEAISAKFHSDGNKGKVEFYFTEFADSSINFMVRFWVEATENLTALQVKSEAIKTIKEVLDKNNISIPFPIRTIINNS
ncbi:MAG: mechanosensitive ion channel family protein [Flavobacteriales bacterium]|nr:mechanosensitive ion channel family protein [Flavobacteriales bacterium]